MHSMWEQSLIFVQVVEFVKGVVVLAEFVKGVEVGLLAESHTEAAAVHHNVKSLLIQISRS